ncbi:hypothetical protein V8G54_003165, partial [Vigna mungo]
IITISIQTLISLQETLVAASSSTVIAILAGSRPFQRIINAQAIVVEPPSHTFIFFNKITTALPHHSATMTQNRASFEPHSRRPSSRNHPRREQHHQPPFVSCNKRPISTVAATSPQKSQQSFSAKVEA